MPICFFIDDELRKWRYIKSPLPDKIKIRKTKSPSPKILFHRLNFDGIIFEESIYILYKWILSNGRCIYIYSLRKPPSTEEIEAALEEMNLL